MRIRPGQDATSRPQPVTVNALAFDFWSPWRSDPGTPLRPLLGCAIRRWHGTVSGALGKFHLSGFQRFFMSTLMLSTRSFFKRLFVSTFLLKRSLTALAVPATKPASTK